MKVVLKWQKDSEHSGPYNEVVELHKEDSDLCTTFKDKAAPVVIRHRADHPYRLEKIEKTAAVAILSDCLEQLSIVRYLTNENAHESWFDLFEYRPLREKFKSSPKKQQQYIEEAYEKIPYTNEQKLLKEICFLTAIVKNLYRDVSQHGDYSTLVNLLKCLKQEEEDNEEVDVITRTNHAELSDLKKKLIKEHKDFSMIFSKLQEMTAAFETEIEDILAYGKEEVRYTTDWENTRSFQNELTLTQQEDSLQNTITNHMTKIDYENRIHSEIYNFIDENTEDYRNSISFWMQHYDEEIERLDDDILKLKMNWETTSDNHQILKETYQYRTTFIEERLVIKEERRIKEELELLQAKAATKIQAWWRGTMVRRKLGPYRKKKKKGKGKKGGKGSKKGKKKKK